MAQTFPLREACLNLVTDAVYIVYQFFNIKKKLSLLISDLIVPGMSAGLGWRM